MEIRGTIRSYRLLKIFFLTNSGVCRTSQTTGNNYLSLWRPINCPVTWIFYSRFDEPTSTPLTCSDIKQPPALIATPSHLTHLMICEEDVPQLFHRPDPGSVSSSSLKVCADQLAPTFTQIFSRSLKLVKTPPASNAPTITPVPKKPSVTGLNDGVQPPERHHRPPAGPPVVCLLGKQVTGWCTTSCNTLTPQVCMHRTGHIKILFDDFSSVFNTIIPDILHSKLT